MALLATCRSIPPRSCRSSPRSRCSPRASATCSCPSSAAPLCTHTNESSRALAFCVHAPRAFSSAPTHLRALAFQRCGGRDLGSWGPSLECRAPGSPPCPGLVGQLGPLIFGLLIFGLLPYLWAPHLRAPHLRAPWSDGFGSRGSLVGWLRPLACLLRASTSVPWPALQLWGREAPLRSTAEKRRPSSQVLPWQRNYLRQVRCDHREQVVRCSSAPAHAKTHAAQRCRPHSGLDSQSPAKTHAAQRIAAARTVALTPSRLPRHTQRSAAARTVTLSLQSP